MKKVIVHENQKALLLKNGRFVKLLSAGKYHLFGDSQIELLPLDQALASEFCPLETLLADPDIAAQTVSVAVADDQLALPLADGNQRVDGLDTGVEGLADGGPLKNRGCAAFDGALFA